MKQELLRRTVRATNGRNGYISSKDRDFTMQLEIPQEMGGKPNDNTNPEELFAAGYSSCFASSMEYLLRSSDTAFESLFAEVTAKLVQDSSKGGFKFAATITASIAGVSEEVKKQIIDNAYQFCPYSRAIMNNVDVEIHIV